MNVINSLSAPPFSNLFQVYDSDCCDSVLLELREYLPKYFGVWSPPTAPNGTVLILSVNLNLLEKSSGAWFLAVTSSVGFSPFDAAFQFAVLWLDLVFRAIPVCNPLAGFGLWDHSTLQSFGWIWCLGSSLWAESDGAWMFTWHIS